MKNGQTQKYSDMGLRLGKFRDAVPWVGVDAANIEAYEKAGKNGLMDAIQKGYAQVYADGRIDLSAVPFSSDQRQYYQAYFNSPRMLFSDIGETGTNIVPIHPVDYIQKASLTTGDAGAYNAIFGAVAIVQLIQQQNAYAAFSKMPYPREGFRAVTAAAVASAVGIAEGASVATAVEPTFLEITVGLKEIAIVTEMSTRLELVATKNDTVTFGGLLQTVFQNFMQAVDVDILQDTDTLAGNNMESIDRVTNTTANAVTGHSYTAGDEDLYGIDRSAVSYFDGNALGNSNVDRPINIYLVDTLYANQYPYWQQDMGNKFWLTGATTHVYWSALEGAKQRFDQATVAYTYANGVQPVIGQAGGFKLTTYNTWPIVLDSNVQTDTLKRIYLNDNNHCGIVVGRPIEVIEANNPLNIGAYVNRAAFYGIQEMWCDLPASCGALWDLSS